MRAPAVGVYRTRDQVAAAVDQLRTNGFPSLDISVLFPDNIGTSKVRAADLPATRFRSPSNAIVGGTLEWLSGVRALVIPGSGPFIAAGPIRDAVDRLAAAGSGLASVLAAIGIEAPAVSRYEARIDAGSILLAVRVADSDWARLAGAIMQRTDATDISVPDAGDGPPVAIEPTTRPAR